MARYKGKREAHGELHMSDDASLVEDAPAKEPAAAGHPAGNDMPPESPQTSPMSSVAATDLGDPFADDEETVFPPDGGTPGLYDRFMDFAATRTGKIVLFTAAIVVALAVAVAIFLFQWVRSPDIPLPDSGPGGSQDQIPDRTPDKPGDVTPPDDGSNQPVGPTDDELYPDDGFNGDIPTVSGERKEGVYTFLLVGTDLDDGNTDTLMVASYDTKKQALSVMSIPRDTMINASWDIKKINSIYGRYGAGERGMSNLMDQIARLIGFRPDFYVKVDLEMFVELVDLVGGVEFDVPQDMKYKDPYQNLYIDLEAGPQVLDGQKAMQLVRFRSYDMGDIERIQVQQSFLKALIKTCISLEHWGKIKSYIDLAVKHVQLSEGLDYGNIVWFAAQALGLGGNSALELENVYTCTLPGNYTISAWSRDTSMMQSYVTIYPNDVVRLINDRFNPYVQDVTTDMLDAMSILSNGDIASSTGSLRDSRHNAIMAVRRGEAYYDEDGNLVYGTKPSESDQPGETTAPEIMQDEEGNYYILDEDGNRIPTDENGTPLTETGGTVEDEPGQTEDGETETPGGSEDETGQPGDGETGESGGEDGGKPSGPDDGTDDPGGKTEEPGGETEEPGGESEEPGGEDGPPEEGGEPDPEDENTEGWNLSGLLGLLGW